MTRISINITGIKVIVNNVQKNIIQKKENIEVSIDITNRICPKCKQEKTLTEYYSDKSKKSGYKSECKDCRKIYYETIKTKNLKCFKCKETKAFTEFYKKNSN